MSFDYGEEPISGGSFENPKVGTWPAVVEAIVHIGTIIDTFKGKKKDPAPFLAVKFVILDEENLKEDGSFHEVWKTFPMFKADKSYLTQFGKAFDPAFPKGTLGGFVDIIGRPCNLELKGSKDNGDDGKPKFVNVGGISGLQGKFEKLTTAEYEETGRKPLGYFKHGEINADVLREFSPFVAQQFVAAENLGESESAVAALKEVRAEDADFGKKRAKEDEGSGNTNSGGQEPANKPDVVDPGLDAQQEF